MNEPMTKAARRHHLKTNGADRCPYCKVDISDMCGPTEHSELEPIEDGTIVQTVKCTNCNRRWQDVFQLVDVHELCDGDVK